MKQISLGSPLAVLPQEEGDDRHLVQRSPPGHGTRSKSTLHHPNRFIGKIGLVMEIEVSTVGLAGAAVMGTVVLPEAVGTLAGGSAPAPRRWPLSRPPKLRPEPPRARSR